jgi:hypothetical protein
MPKLEQPSTAAPLFFLMTSSRQNNVLFNQGAYPALQARSFINQANQTAVVQGTSAAQPNWSGSAWTAPYVDFVYPGTPSLSALTFNGSSQYFEYDSLAGTFSGAEIPVTMTCEVTCNAGGGTICAFGNASTALLSLSYSDGYISLTETNNHGTYTATTTMSAAAHVITAVRANNTLTLRVDGKQVATASVASPGTQAFTTFCVGAQNSSGSVSTYFNGNMRRLSVFGGVKNGNSVADIYRVETYMLLDGGLIRGASQGLQAGF